MSLQINTPADRTFVYENSPFQFVDAEGTKQLLMIKNWNFTPNISDFDIDRIDTAAPIFTKKSDVLGTFNFNTVNTVDFYEDGSAANPTTYKWWATQLALGEPPSVTFLLRMHAPKTAGDAEVDITYIGRIMSIPLDRVDETGPHTFRVNGEITSIGPITRTATPVPP